MNTPPDPKETVIIQQLNTIFTAIPFNRMLGLKLDHLDATHITMNFEMKEELIGNVLQGILHGGVISSVLDMAGGMVAMAHVLHVHQGKSVEELLRYIGKTSTINLNINYVSPGRGTQFIAKAWLIKGGNKIAFTRMELSNESETLIATAGGSYLIR